MLSIKKKFIFIHVPKTGGNSIQNTLKYYSEDEIVILAKHHDGIERFEVRNSQYNTTKHSSLSHYKSILDADIYRSLYKFCTIRNPWDMMISYYFSPHRGINEWDRNKFMTLVNTVPTLRQYICEKSLKDSVFKKVDTLPPNLSGKLDADVDFIMKFECLNQDFKLACKQLAIPFSPLQKRNSSIRDHYSKYYDEELIKVVSDKFIEEIEYGSYSFEKA
jgi:hypothetical protein